MHSDRRRLLDKLLRELVRSEAHAIDHAPREARRLGEAPPVVVLREIAAHASLMRPRFALALAGHALAASGGGISATLSSVRHMIHDQLYDPERAYRGVMLDLDHGVDIVRILRDVARRDELFAVVRWCDDWLVARRTLVARACAQLAWFVDQPEPEPPPLVDTTDDADSAFLDWL